MGEREVEGERKQEKVIRPQRENQAEDRDGDGESNKCNKFELERDGESNRLIESE